MGMCTASSADLGIPASSMRSLAVATLRREPMNPTYANGWRSTCSSTAKSCPMAVRHDEDVITLVKGQGGSDSAVVPHDHLLRAVGFAGVRELRTAVEQRAGKPHARQGRNGGTAHMPAAEHHGADPARERAA